MSSGKILVCGAGGFIGGHLVSDLRRQGHRDIRAVDIKPFGEWYQRFPDVENLQLDLQEKGACEQSVRGAETGLQSGGGHGRDGVHRKQPLPVHAVRADQHAPAHGREKIRCEALFLFILRVRVQRGQAAGRQT
jgi:uncharacterized protein YbjT (DUF2867 family)